MHLPHLKSFEKQPLVFLTACVCERQSRLANQTAFDALNEIWTKSAALDGWFVGHFLLMPDHVHLFAMPTLEAKSLAQWVKG